jgi:hypothetical protein
MAGFGLLALIVVGVVALFGGGPPFEGNVGLGPERPTVQYPDGCAAYGLSHRRCDGIVHQLAARRSLDLADTDAIWMIGGRRPAGQVAEVLFDLRDGTSVVEHAWCAGIGTQETILCTDDPVIRVSSAIDGYADVPCAGEPPGGCASPLPTADPEAVRAAVALERRDVVIPIDHVGAYSVPIGRATLANGILQSTTLSLAETRQETFLLDDDGVRLEVWSTSTGEQLFNRYQHGWRPGVEPVEARVVFTVQAFDPGSALHVTEASVR